MIEVCNGVSRSDAWLKAVQKLSSAPDNELYNLIIEIDEPCTNTKQDREVEKWTDQYLTKNPVNTVAETIFPASEYRRHNANGVYNVYPDVVYPQVRRFSANQQGTYAYRILRGVDSKGETTRPLENIISRIKSQTGQNGTRIRLCYEVAVAQPCDISISQNGRAIRAFPCMSHLSFKLSKDCKAVHLTALYRSQYYFSKALGNFLGLARLLKFVANETDLAPGSLVCHATYAKLDYPPGKTRKARNELGKNFLNKET